MKHINAFIPFIVVFIIVTGCKKTQPPAFKPTSCNIKSSGSMLTNDAILFAVDPAVDGRIYWDFGDNSAIDSGISLEHTYLQGGTYNVKVTIYGDNAQTVMQQISITANKWPAYLISGTRHWRGYYYTSSATGSYYGGLPDSTFGISYIDSSRVSIGRDTLLYYNNTSNDSIVTFGKQAKNISYYSKGDSIVYKISIYYPEAVRINTFTTMY